MTFASLTQSFDANPDTPTSILAAVIALGSLIVMGLLVALRTLWKDGKDKDSVNKEVGEAVKRVNRQLAQFEQIRRFRVLDREFSIERGELTPTMKVRRKQVLENYKHVVRELYLGKGEML